MTEKGPERPSEPPVVGGGGRVGASQLRALFDAIEERYGHEAASDIWLEVFGAYDGTAQT